VIPRSDQSIEEVDVIQQGQVFKLTARGADGRPLWAYRYRLDGRGSARPQVGGFASRAEAEEALRKALARLRPGGCAATTTLADLVEEYLGMHQGEPVTIAKLRWLLGKAMSVLGHVKLADLSAKDIYAWRQTVPEGHRFEATQALRQVLRRAVEWEWLSDNPAKRVPNPQRRAKEKRPFESWEEIEAVAAQLKLVYGPMVVFAAATGLRPSELFGLEWRDVDREAGVVYVRREFANGRLKQTKTRLSKRAVPLQAKALAALEQLPPAANEILFANTRGGRIDFRSFGRRPLEASPTAGRDRADPRPVRPPPYVRDLRPPRRSPGICRLPVHGLEHRDDRLPLRPSRPRQPRARHLTPRRTCIRTGGGRWVDAAAEARNACCRNGFSASSGPIAPRGGRSVDVGTPIRRPVLNERS
jgi:integrase